SKKFTDSHKAYSSQRAEQERVRYEQFMAQQDLIERQKQYAQRCINRYESSMPKEYKTNCYGSASPDGRNIIGYQNCTTAEQRQYAPPYIVNQCYAEARQAVPLGY
ncbi:MAG: hypothetical protein DI626_06420, partial [Micavibrio aeruginosavorus]